MKACLLLLAATLALLHEVTLGFECWTFEARRRALAAQGRIHAPPFAALAGTGADVHIVDFIYTRCPGICQALGSEYQRLQAELQRGEDTRVRLLSVSFDVAHDDAAALASYAERYRARAPLWRVVAPGSAADDRALRQSLGVVAIPDGFGGYVHNGALHVLDAQGRLLAVHDYADWREALQDARRRAAP